MGNQQVRPYSLKGVIILGVIKWSEEAVIDHINKRGYRFIEFVKYAGVNSRVTIQCPKGHSPYSIGFNGFKNGSNCAECKKEQMRKYFGFSKETVEALLKKDGYKLVSEEYINANLPILIECPQGHTTAMTLGNFSKGHRCSKCAGNNKLTVEFIKETMGSQGYTLISQEYAGANDYMEVKCPQGHIYTTRYSRFQQGVRCPKCNEPKGEREIRRVLTKYEIPFETQKTFNELKGTRGGALSYDFYLPSCNTLIEFQGTYHDGNARRQTQEELKRQREHDKRKRKFAEHNNINLLEIWYYNIKNIEQIIVEHLKL